MVRDYHICAIALLELAAGNRVVLCVWHGRCDAMSIGALDPIRQGFVYFWPHLFARPVGAMGLRSVVFGPEARKLAQPESLIFERWIGIPPAQRVMPHQGVGDRLGASKAHQRRPVPLPEAVRGVRPAAIVGVRNLRPLGVAPEHVLGRLGLEHRPDPLLGRDLAQLLGQLGRQRHPGPPLVLVHGGRPLDERDRLFQVQRLPRPARGLLFAAPRQREREHVERPVRAGPPVRPLPEDRRPQVGADFLRGRRPRALAGVEVAHPLRRL